MLVLRLWRLLVLMELKLNVANKDVDLLLFFWSLLETNIEDKKVPRPDWNQEFGRKQTKPNKSFVQINLNHEDDDTSLLPLVIQTWSPNISDSGAVMYGRGIRGPSHTHALDQSLVSVPLPIGFYIIK